MKRVIQLLVIATLFPLGLSVSQAQPDEAFASSAEPVATTQPELSAGGIESGDATSAAMASTEPDGMASSTGAGASGAGGRFNYQADLFTGRFAYTVPIAVAPGRQGAVPSLALGYNSANGNGWCGVGWGLETGFIQRETRWGVPVKWLTNSALAQASYDDSKGFVANVGGVGSTLVLVSAPNANPLEYRQEVETAFLTYKLYNDNHWEVVDKSGNTFFFGQTTATRMENPKAGWTAGVASSTFRWALDKVVDVNGNLTALSYTKDGNTLYLTNIAYNGNINSPAIAPMHTVDFVLGARTDTNITFQAGYRVESRKLLSEIVVKAGGQNVRKYVLAYTNSPSTLRSLLATVTEFGSDFSSALPVTRFSYQVKPLGFSSTTNLWPVYSQGQTGREWNSMNHNIVVKMVDIDADGLPDRVMRKFASPWSTFEVQRNTGSGFASGNVSWGPVEVETTGLGSDWWSPSATGGSQTYVDMVDMNRDGYPDRLLRKCAAPYTNFFVQYNTGLQGAGTGFSSLSQWGPLTNDTTAQNWRAPRDPIYVDIFDMNGDGLPDRVARVYAAPLDRFKILLNTGSGFTEAKDWMPLDSQGYTGGDWNSLYNSNGQIGMFDMNGDGLPDRVMRKGNPPYTCFYVQLNNGYGFEQAETWGPLSSQGQTSWDWNHPTVPDGYGTRVTLMDMNSDGLPDRVMRSLTKFWSGGSFYHSNCVIQLNTGCGFGPEVNWGPILPIVYNVDWHSYPTVLASGSTIVSFFDINGDGLVDRVAEPVNAPYNHFSVQLGQGPFPDLLNVVSNGIGGRLDVTYVPSSQWKNHDKDWVSDPWAEGAKALLPFPVYTVRTVSVSDGLGGSNTITYAYEGGYFDSSKREFRGFARTWVTHPTGNRFEVTHFHQGGGMDGRAKGEYADTNSVAKKGIPYRVETVTTTNFVNWITNRITLNKVEEVALGGGAYFPYISQTITMTSENGVNYRATAQQLTYDNTTGNLTKDSNWGEVNSINPATHTFNDVGSDSVYTHMTYASLGAIKNKPFSVKITSDSGGSTRLRESLFYYDARGNLTDNQVWLDTAGMFISTGSTAYDQYGNPTSSTDAAGITSTVIYDSTYKQFPLTKITATFTNQFSYDLRSGQTIWAMDVNGMVASNVFDVFYRLKETWVSTNAYGAATLWRAKYDYNLGGISPTKVSSNYVRKRVFDAVDLTNGHESYAYSDGLGRGIQSRTEAETGQFRVTDTFYDPLGNPYYSTLPYFSSGSGHTLVTGTKMGSYTEYDSLNRPCRVTPAVQVTFDGSGNPLSSTATGGDTGSPVDAVVTTFGIGTDPWAATATDSEGKSKTSWTDAYGRVIAVGEVFGSTNYYTYFDYDLLGNLYRVTDAANNQTWLYYDSLGRKTAMIDPDMGGWSYAYDNAGRMTQQVDARTNMLRFHYNDVLGRMTAKTIYNGLGTLVASNTFTYDVSRKGALYRVTDRQGWTTNGYDARGRVDKVARYVNVTGQQYVTQTVYDDADRVKDLIYPNGAATIRYTYDTAGNASKVESVAGTGTKEIFYTPGSYTAEGLLTRSTNGNVVTVYSYYTNSLRLKRVVASKGGTTLQDNTYTYDTVSNIKSINDAVHTSGLASGTVTNLLYDDLHRLVQLASVGRGVKRFAYNPIGNVVTNGEFGSGIYAYGAKPHAVTSANGKAYAYDACGNMTTRGTQTLLYDEENQLAAVYGSGLTNAYGYAEGGERLWRYNNSGSFTVWIGGIYELKDGKTLCHVMAGGKRVATFEPLGGGPFASLISEERWVAANAAIVGWMNWPFSEGRTPKTMALFAMLCILVACMMLRRGLREVSTVNERRRWQMRPLTRHSATLSPSDGERDGVRGWLPSFRFPLFQRSHFRPRSLWHQLVTFVSLTALLLGTMPTHVQAAQFNPVFYYYFGDHLGSSSVLTDRAGDEVQRYGYGAFGTETYQNNTSAFEVSNRYTGQTLDEDTGLYYYGARYYDPELGRFIQADTIVPSAANPQTLNRYAYCGNNPMKYVDPTGHIFGIDDAIMIGIAIGAALGGASSAAQGGNIGMGILTGAIGGLFGGLGAWAGTSTWATSTLGAVGGPLTGAVAGGAVGGAISAAVSGGNIGMGALTGAIAGAISFGVGFLNSDALKYRIMPDWAEMGVSGGLGGGVGAEIQGGDFGEGAAYGAAGGVAGYGLTRLALKAVVRIKLSGTSWPEGDLSIMTHNGKGNESSHTGGHAWVEFTPEDGARTTFGTFGNALLRPIDPQPNGLLKDQERFNAYDARRKAHLSPAETKRFVLRVAEYHAMGNRAWTLNGNCSAFARSSWNAATGERLSSGFILNTPTRLSQSISKANGGVLWGWRQ